MTQLGVDIQALTAASGLLTGAAAEFGRGSMHASSTSQAAGASVEATELLGRALAALGGALRRAEGELQQVASHLSAAADVYARTERALAAWQVPGIGGTGGGGG
jgi:hypothetical protein